MNLADNCKISFNRMNGRSKSSKHSTFKLLIDAAYLQTNCILTVLSVHDIQQGHVTLMKFLSCFQAGRID